MPDETLRRLFVAENNRDWMTLAGLLDPEVSWQLVSDATTVIKGRDEYVARPRAVYEARPAARFEVVRERANGRGRVLCELIDDLGVTSIEVFDIRNGLVFREWEFVFGLDAR